MFYPIYQKDSNGQRRIHRVRYELCVLQSLRDKLRCKEIWIEHADHYRNPDKDGVFAQPLEKVQFKLITRGKDSKIKI